MYGLVVCQVAVFNCEDVFLFLYFEDFLKLDEFRMNVNNDDGIGNYITYIVFYVVEMLPPKVGSLVCYILM